MFGFSLSKLIVLALVIAAVWYGFRWLKRIGQAKPVDEPPQLGPGTAPPPAAAEDMVRCARCDSYVTVRGARHCGRADCPFPH